MIVPSRRSFVTGLVALVAAPAIVKASSLMQVAPTDKISMRLITDYVPGDYMPVDVLYGQLSLDDYSRRVLQPMMNKVADRIAVEIMREDAILARDFYDGEQWSKAEVGKMRWIGKAEALERWPSPEVPAIVAPLALAAAAVAIAPEVLSKPVTRRFWS